MKQSWLESKTMFALFSCSAWVVLCLGIFMIYGMIFWGQQTKTFPLDNLIAIVFSIAFMLVIISAILIIIFGMAIHCIFNSDFSLGAKTLWSIFAFFTAPFGAAIYFFTVYRKQVAAHHEV
jgi:hypothetical protein